MDLDLDLIRKLAKLMREEGIPLIETPQIKMCVELAHKVGSPLVVEPHPQVTTEEEDESNEEDDLFWSAQ